VKRRAALRLLAGASVAAGGVALAPAAHALAAPLYKDARAPIPARVADLLGRMTLEEKVGQMIAIWARKDEVMDGLDFNAKKASAAYPNGVGHVTRPSDKRGVPGITGAAGGTAARWRTPRETVAFINAMQRWALNDTRLGIPVLFHEESLHGYMATEATMFPQAIGLAGAFDRDLMRRVQSVIARETRARGVPYVLSPVVDIVRDPALGADRGDVRRMPLSGRRTWRGGGRGVAGTGQVRPARRWQGLRDAQAHDRAWPAGKRRQCRPRTIVRARVARIFPPAVSRDREAHVDRRGDAEL
jgi:hypothetical protein